MKQRHVQWLYGELPELVATGVLGPDVESRLREHYGPVKELSLARLAVVFCAILGAMLIGAGLILVIAYNWTSLGRTVRAALSFAPLVVGQVLVGWTLLRRQASPAWREGSGAFLAMAIGASIALVGQTYHIPGNPEQFLFTWALLGLPLVYLMRSTIVAALYIVGTTAWAVTAQARGEHALWYWPMLGAILPFIWQQYRQQRQSPGTAFVVWVLCLSPCIGLGVVMENVLPGIWILAYTGMLALFCLLGRTWYRDIPGQPFTLIGSLGTVVTGIILTFGHWWRRIGFGYYRGGDSRYLEWVGLQDYLLVLVLLGAVATLAVYAVGQRNLAALPWVGSPLLALAGFALVCAGASDYLPTVMFNLYLFLLGLWILRSGIASGRLAVANGGLGIISLLLIVRFFDGHMGILVRAVAFMVIGAGFLGANLWLSRKTGSDAKESAS